MQAIPAKQYKLGDRRLGFILYQEREARGYAKPQPPGQNMMVWILTQEVG